MTDNHTPPRSIRVKKDLWDKARLRADQEGIPLSSVVVACLEDYVSEDD